MALIRNVAEPTLRKMCHLVVQSGAPISDVWRSYTVDEDLVALASESDTNQHYVRAQNGQARVEAWEIRPLPIQAAKLKIHPEAVQGITPKSAFIGEIKNLGNKFPSRPLELHLAFENVEAARLAIEAGWEVETTLEVEAEAGLEGVAEARAKETVRNRLWGAINSQIDHSSKVIAQTDWSVVAPPYHHVKGVLTWDEEDITTHTENYSGLDFGFTMGRRAKKRGRGWRWHSGYHVWGSRDQFVATLQANGSVNFSLYEFFGENPILEGHPLWPMLQEVAEGPRQIIHRFVSYKGANHVKAVPTVLAEDEPEEDDGTEPPTE